MNAAYQYLIQTSKKINAYRPIERIGFIMQLQLTSIKLYLAHPNRVMLNYLGVTLRAEIG